MAIPVSGIGGTQFDLSPQEAETLYQNGRKAAEQFFSTWDFEAYKAAFRAGHSVKSRRERLHEQMKRDGQRKRAAQASSSPLEMKSNELQEQMKRDGQRKRAAQAPPPPIHATPAPTDE